MPRFTRNPQFLISIIIFCLVMMPFIGMGQHIHLADQHMGSELHSHQAETHGFHLHTSQHDNIDIYIETVHPSDTQLIELDIDSRHSKLFKLFALFSICLVLMTGCYVCVRIIRSVYLTPVRPRFEIFHSLLRGPPVV